VVDGAVKFERIRRSVAVARTISIPIAISIWTKLEFGACIVVKQAQGVEVDSLYMGKLN
jgi:hypothetical protein